MTYRELTTALYKAMEMTHFVPATADAQAVIDLGQEGLILIERVEIVHEDIRDAPVIAISGRKVEPEENTK